MHQGLQQDAHPKRAGRGAFAVLGRGARRIAIAQRLLAESPAHDVFVWPPPPSWVGIAAAPSPRESRAFAGWAREQRVSAAVVVDETLMLEGTVDELHALGVRVLAPARRLAGLELSKLETKLLFSRLGIPTPSWRAVADEAGLARAAGALGFPLYIKRSPSSGSSGVIEVANRAQIGPAWHGRAGREAGVAWFAEAHAAGQDISVMTVTADDGHAVVLPVLQVFPRRTAHPRSALSGGMGAQTTHHLDVASDVTDRVVLPLLADTRARGESYRGALTVNLRVAPDGAWVALEINCHWGDPETQCALAATDFSLSEALIPRMSRAAGSVTICAPVRAAASIVAARLQYPTARTYRSIRYRPEMLLERRLSTVVPYDGTSVTGGWVQSSSGRFCSITAAAPRLDEACGRACVDADSIMSEMCDLDHNPAASKPPRGVACGPDTEVG